MAITLNDFKEGGALRRFITNNGMLSMIGDESVDQVHLLKVLVASVTNVGTFKDTDNDGIATPKDDIADSYKTGDENSGTDMENPEGDPLEGDENTETVVEEPVVEEPVVEETVVEEPVVEEPVVEEPVVEEPQVEPSTDTEEPVEVEGENGTGDIEGEGL